MSQDIPDARTYEMWVRASVICRWGRVVGRIGPRGGINVYSRRIVGWRTTNRMPTELPLDALEMALWTRRIGGESVTGVIHHSHAGSQYTAIRYADRLADAGALASIGSRPCPWR